MRNDDELVDVVDENDCVIFTVTRKEQEEQKLRKRISKVIIRNKLGYYLIQQRGNTHMWPHHWDIGVGETVGAGESYEHAAIRGLQEELGMLTNHLNYFGKYPFLLRDKIPRMVSFFEYVGDDSISPDPVEVKDFRWVDEQYLRDLMKAQPKNWMELTFIMLEKYWEWKK